MKNFYFLIVFFIFSISIFAQTPSYEWVKSIEGDKDEIMNAIQVDNVGNLYVGGKFNSYSSRFNNILVTNTTATQDFTDGYFAKYDAEGNVLWIKQIAGVYLESVEAIDIDAAGNSYVFGSYSSPTLTFDSFTLVNPNITSSNIFSQTGSMDFLAKYDSDGNVLWAKQFGSSKYNIASCLDVDDSGNIILSGGFGGTSITLGTETFTNVNTLDAYYMDVFVSKLDTNGNFIWSKKAGGWGTEFTNCVKFDYEGNVVVCGNFASQTFYIEDIALQNTSDITSNPNNYGSDVFIVKYDSAGNKLWFKNVGGSLGEYASSFDFDLNSNIILAGFFGSDTIALDDIVLNRVAGGSIFITKLDTMGGIIWARNIGVGNGSPKLETLKTDAEGNFYLCGTFFGSNTFDGIQVSSLVNFSYSFFLSKFDSSGTCQFIKNSDSVTHQPTRGYNRIAFSEAGDLYFAGEYRGFTTAIDSFTFTDSNNSINSFISKINRATLSNASFAFNNLMIYPNPTRDVLFFNNDVSNNEVVTVFDMTSRVVKNVFLNTQNQIDVSELKSGVYFLSLNKERFKFIKE